MKKWEKRVFSAAPKVRPDVLAGLVGEDTDESPLASPATWPALGTFMLAVCGFYGCADAVLFYASKRMALLNTTLPDRFGIREHQNLVDFHLHALQVQRQHQAEEARAMANDLIAICERRGSATKPAAPTPPNGGNMTVSIYRSTASGTNDVVVQTNAQTLELFMPALAEAITIALKEIAPEDTPHFLKAVVHNSLPLAFKIAGYKNESVVESRLLTCGHAAPEASELIAHSTV